MLIAAAQQGRAGRRAERTVRIRIGEPHPAHPDPVNVWRRNVLATVDAEVGIAHVIGEDNEDVGLRRFGGVERSQRREQESGED